LLDIHDVPDLYRRYQWNDRHALWGYGADRFPEFAWIGSLETRFGNLVASSPTAPIYLVREMIHWGGSQNGVLEKFDTKLGQYSFADAFSSVVEALHEPERAINAALQIPGLGLSYASKLLRFLKPQIYGALDGQIRKSLDSIAFNAPPPNIWDGNHRSMIRGYVWFIDALLELRLRLESASICRPSDSNDVQPWRAADLEMAIFQRALEQGRAAS
jgi:hypothetical protein